MSETGKFDPSRHIRKVSGADYLEVKWRLVWLREVDPDASIVTESISIDERIAIFKATVKTTSGGVATGYGSETPNDFRDYIEKAETKAIGRALAALGFGTQFAPDLNEGDRIVDAPVQRPVVNGNSTSANGPLRQQVQQPRPEQPTYTGGGGDATRKPTPGQVKFLEDLLEQLGYHMSEEEFAKLTFDSARERIETLKEERDQVRAR
ncbi:MAG: hypothetical protein M3P94_03335 [Chloroflexota bacterium]|nr:hypothetical protein [Chloroflexota bacterium]